MAEDSVYSQELADYAVSFIECLCHTKSTEKIDGAIATIMGLDRAIRCGNDVNASVYDECGILFI